MIGVMRLCFIGGGTMKQAGRAAPVTCIWGGIWGGSGRDSRECGRWAACRLWGYQL